MNAEHLIQKAHSLRIIVFLVNGQLRVHGPRPLPAAFLSELRAHKAELMAALGDHHMSHAEAVQAATEQRTTETEGRMKVFEYRLTDNPVRWLTLLAPGCDLAEAERSLRDRFGERFVSVREWRPTP